MLVRIWCVKHLHDLRTGKPEADVSLHATEEAAREYIMDVYPAFRPWLSPSGGRVFAIDTLVLGPDDAPEEYVELEGYDVDLPDTGRGTTRELSASEVG